MSKIVIGDGTGSGYSAKVDASNRLMTAGVAEHQVMSASKSGTAYGFGMNDVMVPINTNIVIFYIRFDDPNHNFHLNAVVGSWNGGSTTYNKPLSMIMHAGMLAPTANMVVSQVGNMNLASTSVGLATAYNWSGTGSGMTTAFIGQPMNRMFFSQGTTTVDYNGGLILPKGMSLSCSVSAPEAGICSIFFGGWFE